MKILDHIAVRSGLGLRFAQTNRTECSKPPKTFFNLWYGETRHTTVGTKFEGLKVSTGLQKQIGGLFHAGSVGIIMSGWLGAANYGAIAANDIDKYMMNY